MQNTNVSKSDKSVTADKAGKPENEKQLNVIYTILIVAGVVATVCLVFFFAELFKSSGGDARTKILMARQLGATESAVLLSWSGAEDATAFEVSCFDRSGGRITTVRTEQPFAAIHGLEANTHYRVTVTPVGLDGDRQPYELRCTTFPYCAVTGVNVEEIGSGSATVTWTYEGIDPGFTVIAYALDREGKRHFTTEPVAVPVGAESKCTLTGLFSELEYTVCVMPDTRYLRVGKSNFTTLKNSDRYKRLNIIRFVVCENDSENQMMVRSTNKLNPSAPYKTSMILSGRIDTYENVDMTVYLTDTEGRLISESVWKNIIKEQIGTTQIEYRTLMTSFNAPDAVGNYRVLAAFETTTVESCSFSVVLE